MPGGALFWVRVCGPSAIHSRSRVAAKLYQKNGGLPKERPPFWLRMNRLVRGLSRFRALDGGQLRGVDLDAARLLLFRHDALQIDMEQAVLQARGLDLDMLGELEAALEAPAGDALIEKGVRLVGGVGLALAGDGEHAVLHIDRQVAFGKA